MKQFLRLWEKIVPLILEEYATENLEEKEVKRKEQPARIFDGYVGISVSSDGATIE